MHTVVFEGLEPTDVWLRYCGTTGKPRGKRTNKNQSVYREKPAYLTQYMDKVVSVLE